MKKSLMQIAVSLILKYFFLIGFVVLLCVPMGGHLIGETTSDSGLENRNLALMPESPRNLPTALAYSKKLDLYLNDHFGLRKELISWNNQIRYYGLGESASNQLTVGRDGYLFFNSHSAQTPMRMIDFLCGKNVSPKVIDELALRVNDFLHAAIASAPQTSIAFVPTKPVLYQEYLPAWIQRECESNQASLPAVFSAMLAQEKAVAGIDAVFARQRIYPLKEMLEQKRGQQLYPKENFHWHGRGVQGFADYIAASVWKMKVKHPIAFAGEKTPSDMQRFMLGIDLTIDIERPLYEAANIQACQGVTCIPEIRSAGKLGDLSRYRSIRVDEGRPNKLLLISDSFGAGVAGYFSPYFDEVWHISINNSGQLSADELLALKKQFEVYAPDQVLYVFHDFSLTCFSETLQYCPVNLHQVLAQIHPRLQ